jgi:hypothetical protein|tara:strand:+ start:6389 stop:7342 length:954 start_codon:yes stop_codon:yes gene_type:complete
MASTYTSNIGVEKIGAGEQAGTWGTTTNNNLDIIDRSINGVLSLGLTGTTTTLTTTDGTLSEGGHKVLSFTGALSANNTVTISPNDQDKVYIVHNATTDAASSGPYNVILTQGSGGNVTIPNGSFKIVHCDGAGSSAKVTDVTSTLDISSLKVGGTAVTSTAAELNILDGVTSTATELNIVDGDTSAGTTAVAAGDGIVTNDGGTMRQTTAATFSTYFNANTYSAPSAITSTSTLTPSAAQSIYQRVDTSGGDVTLTLAVGSLAVGQYIIVDKTSTSNALTMAYASNSQGVTLGNACDFAFAIYNGTAFSFIESIKG